MIIIYHNKSKVTEIVSTETGTFPSKINRNIAEVLIDLTDKFMEEYMGKYGRCYFDGGYGTIRVYNINDMDIQKFVMHHIDIFNELDEKLDDNDTNLFNIRDEIVGELNQLKYLLTLK
jgi:hypothetical protein